MTSNAKRYVLPLLLSLFVLLPAAANAGENTLYCLLDLEFRPNLACVHHSAVDASPSISRPRELSEEELDRIVAGGLEHFRMGSESASEIIGRIILWDEVPTRRATMDGPAPHLPTGYSMKQTRVVGTFGDGR